ncbi:MAG: DoxX family protein [Kangiellaceae bacterium]|nr:DoxX family protein [Kangiellaceae bacterium]
MLANLHHHYQTLISAIQRLDGLAPLAIRLFLFFPFVMAGEQKLMNMEETIYWFEHSLKLPLPTFMAYVAALTEYVGAFLLLLGLATRIISIPLLITMLVAALAVHWDNGWFAIAQSSDPEVASRLDAARSLLQEHGHYDWLTERGSFVILNNGIEFAVTYVVMLLSLLFSGGGRYTSADFWLNKLLFKKD